MKIITKLLAIVLLLFAVLHCKAQLPNGSIAKDFTLTDIQGVTHNLYSYLNAGKIVYIDCSATWCGPCWSYHLAGSFKDLHNQRGPNGTLSKDVIVLFVEVDSKTSLSDLQGVTSSGAQPTQGDWITGEPYPFIDLAGPSGGKFFNDYMIKNVPTIYRICPDKKLDYLGYDVKTAAQLYAYASSCGSSVDIEENEDRNHISIYPNPAVDVAVLDFYLTQENPVSISVINDIGQQIFTENIGQLSAGAQKYTLNTSSYSQGLYFITVKTGDSIYSQKISVGK